MAKTTATATPRKPLSSESEWVSLIGAARIIGLNPWQVKGIAFVGMIRTRDLPIREVYYRPDVERVAKMAAAPQ